MSGPNGEPNMSIDEGIINDEDDFEDEEYTAINSMLDQINSYLDDLEEKNDALNGKLHDLLESNREARVEFRAQLLGAQTQEETSAANEESSAANEELPSSNDDQNKEGDGQQTEENL